MNNTGKEYEKIVASIHQQFADGAIVTENEKIKGKSGRERQIDVSIRSQVVGYEILIIVQCKDYKRKVDIEKVDSLIGTLEDVGAAKGILVSNSGFSDGALKRAKQDGRIELVSVVDVENEKLRAQIGIPVLADLRSVTSMSVGINETSTIASSFDYKMLNDAKNKFAKLWNAGEIPSNSGDNEYKDLVIDTPQQRREIIYNYTVQRRLFFKQVGLEKGSGIYNVSDGTFRSKSITTQVVRFDEILTTWQEVDQDKDHHEVFGIVLYAGLPELPSS